VLVSHREDRQRAAAEAIRSAVAAGRLSEARIDESVRRLLALKAKRGLLTGAGEAAGRSADSGASSATNAAADVKADAHAGVGALQADLSLLAAPAHMEVARRISEASVTLVRSDADMLPLVRQKTLVITAAPVVATLADEAFETAAGLGAVLRAHGLNSVDRIVPAGEFAANAVKLLEEAEDEQIKQIVVATYNAQFNPGQPALVKSLLALGKPLAVVALRNPYDLLVMPEVQTYSAVYESRPLALESVAKALLGEIAFQGRLPVSLGTGYPAGWGLHL
jgi:beta-N-acetylhexosaminidase